jgi:hypothetical protein
MISLTYLACNDQGLFRKKVGITSLDYPGAITSSVNGINNSGQIVENYPNTCGTHGFLKNGATMLGVVNLPNQKLIVKRQKTTDMISISSKGICGDEISGARDRRRPD